jgi:glycosyltransferase involved in cell wall biosynthesis
MDRIVYVMGQLGVGGTEKQLLELVSRLDRKRWEPSIVCLSVDPTVAQQFEHMKCSVKLISRKRLGRAKAGRCLFQFLRTVRPSIVQPFAYAWYLAIPAARLASVPWVVVAERTIPPWKGRFHILGDRLLLQWADRAIVNSDRVLEDLVKVHRMPEPRCRVVYNGIDLRAFDAVAGQGSGSDYRLKAEGPIICAVANTKEDKQLDVLIEAFAIVHTEFEHARLWIVGDGELRGELEQLAANLRLHKHVAFLGIRSDVPAILRQATIGVNSSRIEGLCNAVIEYMAAGIPVVATNVGGNSELVVHGKTGLLVPPSDPVAMAEAVLRILRDADTAFSFGQAGRRRVEEHFTMERMVIETERVYEELLSQSRN